MRVFHEKNFKEWLVNFFSGFYLRGEESLFSEYINTSNFTVSGFSLGAIKAFKYALESDNRIDTLQLFSPAFFQDKSKKFKRLQTIHFQKNPQNYLDEFLKNCTYPSTVDMASFVNDGTLEDLQTLLEFVWKKDDLELLVKKGVEIEVYLGGYDKIIDSKKAYEFFKEFATVYFIKEGGHVLHG